MQHMMFHGSKSGGVGRDPAGARARGVGGDSLSSRSGGDSGDRTRNLRLAKPALSQLSYIPWIAALTKTPHEGAPERYGGGGPEWTRTTHLALIRRAL
jgi:hypothetical protein